jgi:hypothetical protein
MTATKLRQRLHEFIDVAEEKKLKAIYTLLGGDIFDEDGFSAEQKAVLDSRMAEYENGTIKSYTWDETVAIALQELKKREGSK